MPPTMQRYVAGGRAPRRAASRLTGMRVALGCALMLVAVLDPRRRAGAGRAHDHRAGGRARLARAGRSRRLPGELERGRRRVPAVDHPRALERGGEIGTHRIGGADPPHHVDHVVRRLVSRRSERRLRHHRVPHVVREEGPGPGNRHARARRRRPLAASSATPRADGGNRALSSSPAPHAAARRSGFRPGRSSCARFAAPNRRR